MPRLRPEVTPEYLNQRSSGRLPGLLGMEVTAVSESLVAMRMHVRSYAIAPNGYLHGGTVVGLADTACGYGALAYLPEGASGFTTIELKSSFLATAREGVIECDARPAHLGRSTQVWDAEVRDQTNGRRLALFRCTQMILWPA